VSAISGEARPRLARGVRLRQDHVSGSYLLLRPERGFELRGSALDVVRQCDGASAVDEIIERLASAHHETPRAQVAGDVTRLLAELVERGLIAVDETGGAGGSEPPAGDGR
jgi:pyrroloquinoline quinone biosynthesis protein D